MIYLELFWTFFTIGAFTFGGGLVMLPMMQQAVAEKGWIDAQSVVNFIAVSESTPGPFAVNMATYVGSEVGGFLGAVCSTLGIVMPSFIIILIVAKCYDRFRQSRIVKGCMSGLKPAVVGLIGSAVVSVVVAVFFPAGITLAAFADLHFYIYAGIFALTLFLALRKVHPIFLICLSAVLGIVVGYLPI